MTSVSSPSVMLQLSTVASAASPTQLRGWLRQICPSGVKPAGRIVLQDIAGTDGALLTSYLDVIEPFLPGASTHPCFGKVYVGTVEPNWTGTGNAYVDGVQDATFVSSYLAQSAQVARAFVARYPQVTTNWYVTYEANLNDLYYPSVESAFQTLLSGEIQARSAILPGREVMWSPAFWYPYSSYSQNTLGMSGLSTSLTTLFTALRASGGLTIVDLQDYVSGSSCQPVSNRMTSSDAVSWVKFLRGLTNAPQVLINTEQYGIDCATGGITNGTPSEVLARESYYQANGLTLGPAFELRYWIYNHE
ncbi:MAG TPA: hypothetical protein VFH54_16505 [Mycobacteriales bacterium]|nr:hypothetical protein [Mycobacteriales bacterium]